MAEVAEERKVGYVRMDEGTVEDYALAADLARPFMAATPERLLAFMESLHYTFPGGQIDRYAHCLQTATRAEDAGECEEIVVAGLLHDIGDSLAPRNHAGSRRRHPAPRTCRGIPAGCSSTTKSFRATTSGTRSGWTGTRASASAATRRTR